MLSGGDVWLRVRKCVRGLVLGVVLLYLVSKICEGGGREGGELPIRA